MKITITKERAKEILDTCSGSFGDIKLAFIPSYMASGYRVHPKGVTQSEDEEIRKFWLGYLPSRACYRDAVIVLAQGKADAFLMAN